MKLMSQFLGAIVIIFLGFASGAHAQNVAEGSLTVDGERTLIKHAYADVFDGDITIILSSETIPKESIPDGVYDLGKQGKFRGLMFVVSGETKSLLTSGLEKLINAIHFPPVWNQLGSIGNGVLTTSKFDENSMEGQLTTSSENSLAGHRFSYDISFSVSIKKEPMALSITGHTDPPGQAFAAWGTALLAGDLDGYRTHASQEVLAMLPTDEKELAYGIELQQRMFPTKIAILGTKVDGTKAILTMIGQQGSDVSDGTAIMLLEDGKWKVSKQSWESSATGE